MSVFRNQFLENLITTPFPLLTPFLPHPLPFNFPLGWEFPGSASSGLGEGGGSCFIREDNLIGTTDLNNSPSKGPDHCPQGLVAPLNWGWQDYAEKVE